jgi:hypothetical protein
MEGQGSNALEAAGGSVSATDQKPVMTESNIGNADRLKSGESGKIQSLVPVIGTLFYSKLKAHAAAHRILKPFKFLLFELKSYEDLNFESSLFSHQILSRRKFSHIDHLRRQPKVSLMS